MLHIINKFPSLRGKRVYDDIRTVWSFLCKTMLKQELWCFLIRKAHMRLLAGIPHTCTHIELIVAQWENAYGRCSFLATGFWYPSYIEYKCNCSSIIVCGIVWIGFMSLVGFDLGKRQPNFVGCYCGCALYSEVRKDCFVRDSDLYSGVCQDTTVRVQATSMYFIFLPFADARQNFKVPSFEEIQCSCVLRRLHSIFQTYQFLHFRAPKTAVSHVFISKRSAAQEIYSAIHDTRAFRTELLCCLLLLR